MLMNRRRALLLAAVSSPLATVAAPETFPDRPIKIIVPFPAGGSADAVTRAVGVELGAKLGVQIVVDNKPGAGTNIGAAAAYAAPPDGYTLFLAGLASNSTNKYLYKQLAFEPDKFVPIGLLVVNTFFLVVSPNSPAKSVKDLVRLARQRPQGLVYGSNGIGTPGHLLAELFGQRAGIKLVHVPYKGSSESNLDLMRNSIDFMFDNSAINLVHSGKLRALAVAYERRWPGEEDLPTMQEAGFPGVTVSTYFGLVAPPKTPSEIVTKVNKALNEVVLTNIELRAKLLNLGGVTQPGTPAETAAFIRKQSDKWGAVIKTLGIRMD